MAAEVLAQQQLVILLSMNKVGVSFMTKRKVLIPGTFDPITAGHLDVIERSSTLFDEVVVGVAASRNKGGGPLFTIEERVNLAKQTTAHLPNVSVVSFNNLLVDFAKEIGAVAIVKGLRVTTDFEMEFQMAALNSQLEPELETLFVMSSTENMYVSSSVVKEIASFGGDVSSIVSPCVEKALKEKFDK
jgi:pantetheine-phosphate adenylyltransferase